MSRFPHISRVETTSSTNDDVARILGEEQARGLVRVAAYQDRGTGRKGRAWIAPPGAALLCTLALPDPVSAPDLWIVPFWAAIVAAEALRSLGVDPLLQWPNDVLASRHEKIAGILCISRVTGPRAWAACGIGINVQRPADGDAYAELDALPAFVSDYAPHTVDETLEALLHAADSHYELLPQPETIIKMWEAAASVPGAHYRILLDRETEPFDATALRLLPGGALEAERNGSIETIDLADARVLRYR